MKFLAVILGLFAAQVSAIPILCDEEVSGVLANVNQVWKYEFVALQNSTIQPSTCGYTFGWDTYIEVRQNGVVLEFSDNLGNKVCPGSPAASAVTVGVTAGYVYEISLKAGANYEAPSIGKVNSFTMNLHCSEPIENYWATMFANSGYDFGLFASFNAVWYYNGKATCVGKGKYFHICPFHHLYCPGEITYGWGSQQRDAVLAALSQSTGQYEGYENCPLDIECTGMQYTCLNERCVDQAKLCDGTDDCLDGSSSDENNGINLGLCEFSGNEPPVVTPPPNNGGGDDDTLVTFGCTSPGAVNYNPEATVDDGSCEACFDAGESLHLVTDKPSKLLPERCGLAMNGDLKLAARSSMKYPRTVVALLEPYSGDKPFDTEYDNQGRDLVAVAGKSVYWDQQPGDLCTNDYDGVWSWTNLVSDDDSTVLVTTELNDGVMFTGFVAVDMYEQLDPLRGVNLTRCIAQKLPFRIIFNTDVLFISGEVMVHDTQNALFAVIEQKTVVVDGSANPPAINADIVLYSSVQWPYRLTPTDVSVDVPALNNNFLSVSLYEDCSPAKNKDCNQKWLIRVNLQNQCAFTGTYTVDFDIECVPNANTPLCPLTGDHTTSVDFDLQSENVCPQIVDEVVALGSSRSFMMARQGTLSYNFGQQNSFMVNTWSFFEIHVESIDGLVVETTITSIELCFNVGCNNPINLYNGNSFLVPALSMNILNYPRSPNVSPLPLDSDIHMYLSDTVFQVPLDGSLSFQLRVGLEVEYYSTQSLLGEDAERDPREISLESYRNHPKMRKMHLTAVSDTAAMDLHANGDVTGAAYGERPHAESDAGPSADASAESGGAATTRGSAAVMVFVSVFVIALTVAIWR